MRKLTTALLAAGLTALSIPPSFAEKDATSSSGELTDQAIFAIYDQVNGFDIETAALGAVRGHSVQVRELAVMVLRDHSAVQQMARDIASDTGVSYEVSTSDQSARAHAEKLSQLNELTGEAFDRAYLAHERAFHKNAIAAIETILAPSVKSDEMAAHFSAVLPGFRHHLSETIRVQKELRYAEE